MTNEIICPYYQKTLAIIHIYIGISDTLYRVLDFVLLFQTSTLKTIIYTSLNSISSWNIPWIAKCPWVCISSMVPSALVCGQLSNLEGKPSANCLPSLPPFKGGPLSPSCQLTRSLSILEPTNEI